VREQDFPHEVRIRALGTTVEAQRVAVEAVSHGTTADGKTYKNCYHVLLELDDAGKVGLRAYMDTAHAEDVFGG
jgi:ketosteroid isomerase-like protein